MCFRCEKKKKRKECYDIAFIRLLDHAGGSMEKREIVLKVFDSGTEMFLSFRTDTSEQTV